MKIHFLRLMLPFFLFFTLACGLTNPFSGTQENNEVNLSIKKTPTLINNSSGSISANKTKPADQAFHINLIMDEKVLACSGNVKCDYAYLPKMTLYLRGDMQSSSSGSLSGTGKMIFLNVEKCATLMPDNSSCQVNSVGEGTFSIDGKTQGDKLNLTLKLGEMPKLSVTMKVSSGMNVTTIPMDSTYQEELKLLFKDMGLFDKSFEVSPALNASANAAYFEGSGVFGGRRTLHGYGGLFFIDPAKPLPASFTP